MTRQRGSILFFILLGVVLFAAISAVVMRMMAGGGDYGRVEVAKLGAQSLIEYADKAKLVVQDMKLNGVAAANMSFLRDGDAGYTTAPHTAKVFHPSGGALPVQNFNDLLDLTKQTVVNDRTTYMTRGTVDQVGTSALDIIMSVVPIKKDVCEQVEKGLYGTVGFVTVVNNFADTLGNIPFASDPIECTSLGTCLYHTRGCMYFPEGFYGFYAVVDAN